MLVFAMQAGFCLLESGLARAKNGINMAAKNLADLCLSSALFWMVGFGLMFGRDLGGWLGSSDFFFPVRDSPYRVAFFVFQCAFCGTATTVLSGAIAERARFSTYLALAGLTSAFVYPLFGHWAWAGSTQPEPVGWLAALGFRDFAGASVVHTIGGGVALAGVLRVGPRLGRFVDGRARVLQGHNLPAATVGSFLLMVGWFGFNCGSTLGVTSAIPLVAANSLIAASFGGLAAILGSVLTKSCIDVILLMNGVLAGLVSITGAAAWVSVGDAAAIGCLGGWLMIVGSRVLERLRVDDAIGAVPVHGLCGLWGTLAVGLFAPTEMLQSDLGRLAQIGVQLLGGCLAVAWSFSATWVYLGLIESWLPIRVSQRDETVGLNVAIHGARSDLQRLLTELEQQRETGDLSKPVHVELGTSVGEIAAEYNRVRKRINDQQMELQGANRESQELSRDLAHARDAAVEARTETQRKLDELARFNQFMLDRELRMITLKQTINRLSERLGESPPFPSADGRDRDEPKPALPGDLVDDIA